MALFPQAGAEVRGIGTMEPSASTKPHLLGTLQPTRPEPLAKAQPLYSAMATTSLTVLSLSISPAGIAIPSIRAAKRRAARRPVR